MALKDKASGNSQKLPTDRLRGEFQNLLGAVGQKAVSSLHDKVGGMTGRLTDYAENSGNSSLVGAVTGAKDIAEGKSPTKALLGAGTSGIKDKVKNMFGGGGGGGQGGKKLKVTNIEESIDVGVPVRVAYNQWTEFADFPSFMKKVENVEQEEDEKLTFKAQVFWSHRTWEATIQSQVPDEKIVWRSKGEKGHVDGAVTFHELAPNLTRILVVLEYHPQGFMERTGNLWRAQGRRVRLELKHFRRHVMSEDILHPDEIEGWRGVIEDGEVVKDHETAVQEEEQQEGAGDDTSGDSGEPDEDDTGRAADDAEDEEPPADEEAEEEPEDDEEPEDEAPGDEELEDEELEDEEPSPNGHRARQRPARGADGARGSGRGPRRTGRESRSRRSDGGEGRPQRATRRRTASRGGSQ